MSDILCVTNRALCKENFLARIGKIASNHPAGIILREKDLPEAEYKPLAEQVLAICEKHQVPCMLHSFVDTAIQLNVNAIHLTLPVLRKLSDDRKRRFQVIGASCHSIEDAQEAQRLGCTYITAGHIFPTDCKRGLPGRGIDFLRRVCESSSVPVYAIGGIDRENIEFVRKAGVDGVCLMSGLMKCADVEAYFKNLEKVGGENAV